MNVDIWQRWTVGIGHGQPRRGADADFRYGSWLRDNALPQPATVHDPVNVVRQGQSEQFFPVGRSWTASELSWAMLGKGWPEIGSQWVSTLTL